MRWRSVDMSVRIVVPMFALLATSVALLLVYIWWSTSRQTIDASIIASAGTVHQFRTLRAYYTENVVNKVKQAGAMKIAADHAGRPDTIPLPATMIHDLSEALGRGGSGAGIFVNKPFQILPGRSGPSDAGDDRTVATTGISVSTRDEPSGRNCLQMKGSRLA